jgi:hypothetical protein
MGGRLRPQLFSNSFSAATRDCASAPSGEVGRPIELGGILSEALPCYLFGVAAAFGKDD